MILPAAYNAATKEAATSSIEIISIWLSIILIAVYGLGLVFSLVTHRSLFSGSSHADEHQPERASSWGLGRSVMVLAGATAAIAWMSEILVGVIEPAAEALHLNDAFVGVFVVAILGNAAEHSSAVGAAMKDRMDLSLSIAIGSSVQVALFVAPLLVLLSYVVAPSPMSLAFSGGLVLTILLAVLITGQVAADGRSDWLRGAQLIAVYLILGIMYFFAA